MNKDILIFIVFSIGIIGSVILYTKFPAQGIIWIFAFICVMIYNSFISEEKE
jgi:hypothetical protein